MSAIDHLHDPLKDRLVELSYDYEVPEFVKQASDAALARPAATVQNAYALPHRKALPLHTKAAAWLSAIYLDNNPKIAEAERKLAKENLTKAFNVYGMEWPSKKPLEEEAPPANEDYLLEFEKNGSVHRRLPVRNEQEANLAVAYLNEHREELNVSQRKTASERLLVKLAAYGMAMNESDISRLQKDACQFVIHSDDLAFFLTKKANLANFAGCKEASEQFSKVAKEVKAIDGIVEDSEFLFSALESAEFLDSQLKMLKSAAVDSLNAIPRYEMENYCENTVVLKSGHSYLINSLAKLPASTLLSLPGIDPKEVSPDGICINMTKIGAVLEQLPMEKAEAVVAVIKKAGVEHNFYVQPGGSILSSNDWAILGSD